MSAPFKLLLAALALLVGTAGLTLLHLENRRLERRLIADAARAREAARLRADNARLERLLADQRQGAETAGAQVRRDLAEVRTEIAALEKKAAQQQAAQLAATLREAAALDAGRDPRQGPTRLEYFQNRGQATPAAAFETLVWAALKGDDATLAAVTTLNSATRARMDAWIARLPADERATWTAEKLGRLWFTGLFTELSAIQIAGETITGGDDAVVRLRVPGRDDETLSVRLTPAGWKVLVPTAAIDHLRKKLEPGK